MLFRCVCSQGDIIFTHIFYFRCRFGFQLSYILSSYHKNCMRSQIECEFSMTMRGLTNTHRYVQANSPHIIIKYTLSKTLILEPTTFRTKGKHSTTKLSGLQICVLFFDIEWKRSIPLRHSQLFHNDNIIKHVTAVLFWLHEKLQ